VTTAVFSIVGAIYVLGVVTSAAWLKCAELSPDPALSDGEIVKLSILSPFLSVGVAYSWVAGYLFSHLGVTLPGTRQLQDQALAAAEVSRFSDRDSSEERTTHMPLTFISAVEALQLPSAQLTDEQVKLADKILETIKDAIRNKKMMRNNGFEFTTNNNDPGAMFAAANAIIEAGFNVGCESIFGRNRFKPEQAEHTGYKLTCSPTKESVAAAALAMAAAAAKKTETLQ
jgi:hypothetical protein